MKSKHQFTPFQIEFQDSLIPSYPSQDSKWGGGGEYTKRKSLLLADSLANMMLNHIIKL